MDNRGSLPPLDDDFTQALLRSAESDEPSNAAYAKVAAALGVGAAIGVGASMPAPAAVVAGASAASALARWSGSLAAKLALLGVSGALLLGASGGYLWHRAATRGAAGGGAQAGASVLPVQPHVATAAAVAPSQPEAAVVPGPASPANAALAAAVAPLAATGAAPVRALRHVHAAARLAASGSSLPEQVQSLDRARVALSSGDASTALVEIAHYRKAWPKGVFLTEASVLEIEALAKRGERSLAAMRAQAFVTAHPDSPQAERLRALIPAAQP
ncbi:MAG TPA: hypothetical protein VGL19_03815 [Polyangiaceae bacterium]